MLVAAIIKANQWLSGHPREFTDSDDMQNKGFIHHVTLDDDVSDFSEYATSASASASASTVGSRSIEREEAVLLQRLQEAAAADGWAQREREINGGNIAGGGGGGNSNSGSGGGGGGGGSGLGGMVTPPPASGMFDGIDDIIYGSAAGRSGAINAPVYANKPVNGTNTTANGDVDANKAVKAVLTSLSDRERVLFIRVGLLRRLEKLREDRRLKEMQERIASKAKADAKTEFMLGGRGVEVKSEVRRENSGDIEDVTVNADRADTSDGTSDYPLPPLASPPAPPNPSTSPVSASTLHLIARSDAPPSADMLTAPVIPPVSPDINVEVERITSAPAPGSEPGISTPTSTPTPAPAPEPTPTPTPAPALPTVSVHGGLSRAQTALLRQLLAEADRGGAGRGVESGSGTGTGPGMGMGGGDVRRGRGMTVTAVDGSPLRPRQVRLQEKIDRKLC